MAPSLGRFGSAGHSQLHQRGVTHARGTGRGVGRLLAEVSRAGDIQMDPRHGRELAQEEGASDHPSLSRTRVGEVRIPAIEVLAVFLDHGQLPIPVSYTHL